MQRGKYGWTMHIPKFAYTTDNAAMVAMSGYFRYLEGKFAPLDVAPYSKVFV